MWQGATVRMRAKEVVGKARPRLSMLWMHQRLRVPQGCFTPQQGWRMTTLLPLSAVGCASRSSLPPPAHCQAFGLEGRGGLGGAWAGGWRCGEGAGGPPPGGAVQQLTPAPASPGVGARRPTRDGRSGSAGMG